MFHAPVFVTSCLLVVVCCQVVVHGQILVQPLRIFPSQRQQVDVGSISQPIFGGMDGVDGGFGFLDFSYVGFYLPSNNASSSSSSSSLVPESSAPPTTNNETVAPSVAAVPVPTLKLTALVVPMTIPHASPGDFFQNNTNASDTSSSSSLSLYLSTVLGIGAFDNQGRYFACCTLDAQAAGVCNTDSVMLVVNDDNDDARNFSAWGSLILDQQHQQQQARYRIHHFELSPSHYGYDYIYADGIRMEIAGGYFALIFANCPPHYHHHQDNKQQQQNNGTLIVTSVHIAGTVLYETYLVSTSTIALYLGLVMGHMLLVLWYHHLMKLHNNNMESRIGVEKNIFGMLKFTALAKILKLLLFLLPAPGIDFDVATVIMMMEIACVVATHAMAHGVSMLLYLNIALGIDVTRAAAASDTQQAQHTLPLVCWLSFYSGLSVEVAVLRYVYEGLFVITSIIRQLLLLLHLIFIVCIAVAIRKTIAFLQARSNNNNNEPPHKLIRYQWMWRISLLAVSFSLVQWMILYYYDSQEDDIIIGDIYLLQQELTDVMNWVILTCVAYLWRPNPYQHMYAYPAAPLDSTTELDDNAADLGESPTMKGVEMMETKDLLGKNGKDDSVFLA